MAATGVVPTFDRLHDGRTRLRQGSEGTAIGDFFLAGIISAL